MRDPERDGSKGILSPDWRIRHDDNTGCAKRLRPEHVPNASSGPRIEITFVSLRPSRGVRLCGNLEKRRKVYESQFTKE
jgi:hypothetical protein